MNVELFVPPAETAADGKVMIYLICIFPAREDMVDLCIHLFRSGITKEIPKFKDNDHGTKSIGIRIPQEMIVRELNAMLNEKGAGITKVSVTASPNEDLVSKDVENHTMAHLLRLSREKSTVSTSDIKLRADL